MYYKNQRLLCTLLFKPKPSHLFENYKKKWMIHFYVKPQRVKLEEMCSAILFIIKETAMVIRPFDLVMLICVARINEELLI